MRARGFDVRCVTGVSCSLSSGVSGKAFIGPRRTPGPEPRGHPPSTRARPPLPTRAGQSGARRALSRQNSLPSGSTRTCQDSSPV